MDVTVAGVGVVIDDHSIISDVSMNVQSGELHGVIGPNLSLIHI